MKLIDCLDELLPLFEVWYSNAHGLYEDSYSHSITQRNLSNISDEELIKFFIEFRECGGKIQSLGSRNINDFSNMLHEKLKSFREYILQPFNENFDLHNWLFRERKQFKYWGVGIASIYLVRINKNKYAVLNNKTINALKILGFKNVTTQLNLSTYLYVHEIQQKIINKYQQVSNFHKADALFHYIVAEIGLNEISAKIEKEINKALSVFEDELEQERTYNYIKTDIKLSNRKQILARLKELSQNESEYETYTGNRLKRNTYNLELIKQLRGYRCQFCTRYITKKNGNPYVEACHIKPKSEGGCESLINILILCPNCHKTFDLGHREDIIHTSENYIVIVNGQKYNIKFENEECCIMNDLLSQN